MEYYTPLGPGAGFTKFLRCFTNDKRALPNSKEKKGIGS